MRRRIFSLARKELNSYFGSPLAFIFLGTFLAAVLFIFFSIETFFARGIADVRPLFRWMPVLLIFLLAALTMRQWSEEQRSGTQELLLTLPVPMWELVVGKFMAVMGLISLALALTLPLPITVSLLGNLDWGPVIGGYIAALLMAAGYAAIGLFVSSRTDNQIVALISTVLLGGLFYVVGTRSVTDFAGSTLSELFWAIGTGSRFESIQRGVIDLRDLVYYLSLTAVFLILNTVSLDSVRWSQQQDAYRARVTRTATLLIVNLLLLNVWLYPLQRLRVDLTAQNEYTLSQTTKDLFANLQEPLLVRAYISADTHPLLAPLAPQVEDMLREYEITSDGRITAEVIDPITNPEIESEANQTYGIQPMALQTAGRYEASVINAYFDILIRYGDQTVVLNFQDLAAFDLLPDGSTEVTLDNLEYDLTSGIKKVVFGFQSVDAVLAALAEPVTLTFYVTSATAPDFLQETIANINTVATDIAAGSSGKFSYEVIDLDDPNSPVTRAFLLESYGLQPFSADLFGTTTFYAHMLLDSGEDVQVMTPTVDETEATIRTMIESALKRTSSGFLKVAGLWTPPVPTQAQGGELQPLSSYQLIEEQLRQEYTVQRVELSGGQVPNNIDVLIVVEPLNLTEVGLFAIDQYLMRGGSVMLAANNYQLVFDSFQNALSVTPISGGVGELLSHYGIEVEPQLVFDEQNSVFPVATTREVNGIQVQEIQAVDYPLFIDVRADGMAEDNPTLNNLPAVTMSYASPVAIDEEKNAGRETAVLLRSSAGAWTSTDTRVEPDFALYPSTGFPVPAERESYPLAVAVQGSFDSYFQDRPNPLLTSVGSDPQTIEVEVPLTSIVEQSPASSRLLVIGSAAYIDDFTLNLSARLSGDLYLNNLQFFQNSVDWAVEDLDLLSIRARGNAVRVLRPLETQEQSFWEIANYVIALLALLALYFSWRTRVRNERPLVLEPVEQLSVESGR